ncbi:MAG: thioredoxin domain-containing protein [Nitrososphaerales archaeon]
MIDDPTHNALSQSDLYRVFKEKLSKFEEREWNLVLFEGSPTDNSYSWCPDCVFALDHIRKFKASYGGPVSFLQFKVGSRGEWESGRNPFKRDFPFLSDLPTAVLLRGKIDAARVIAPEQGDLLYLCERTVAYERQIKMGAWNPPKKIIR